MNWKVPVGQVLKQIQPASKPDQPGLSSTIRLEVIYVGTQATAHFFFADPVHTGDTSRSYSGPKSSQKQRSTVRQTEIVAYRVASSQLQKRLLSPKGFVAKFDFLFLTGF